MGIYNTNYFPKIQISSHLSQFSLQHILQLNIQNSNYQPLFTVFIVQQLTKQTNFPLKSTYFTIEY